MSEPLVTRQGELLTSELRERRGWTIKAIERLELGFDGERVTFPVRNGAGDHVGFVRYLPGAGNGDKMRADEGTTRELFPPVEMVDNGEGFLWLVEGEPDCARATSLGLDAVAVPGTAGWRTEWAPRFSGRRVAVCFDADAPGRAAAKRAASDLIANGIEARIVDLAPDQSDGFDLTDFTAKAKTEGEREEARRLLEEWAAKAPLADRLVSMDDFRENGEAPIKPFAGLTHDEVLKLTFEGESELVEDLIEAGVLGAIAGIPETHKSWLAQAIAVGVARGEGEVLGKQVVAQGSVGYFWQDDSRRNEAERVQTLERVRANPAGLPLRWFLNEGLELPRDLERLRATVERFELCLVVIDSFYNVAADADLKDRDAGQIVAALKARVCDPTGCTVLIVDHMPWATDSNRARLRTYGDVFKGAATRFGIYIDAERKKLYVEARGNNIRGFKRSPAYWDAETLELRLADTEHVDADELDARVLKHVTEHPGDVTKKVEDEVAGGRESIRKSLERLASHELVATGPGRHPSGKYWYPVNHEALQSPGDSLATLGDMSPGPLQGQLSPESPLPRRGGDSAGDNMNGGE
jgi:hypothetical protein